MSISGIREAIEKYSTMPDRVQKAAKRGCVLGGFVLEGAIKEHIRVNPHPLKHPDRRGQMFHEGLIDLGTMIDSVSTTEIADGAEVGPHVDYARWHEFGTEDMPARPFMRPARDEKEDEVVRVVEAAIAEEKAR